MDPLLQPYRLKHLELRNRIITTSHEPAYPVDGMPTSRYIAYHAERAKGGVAMTMTAGSAAVSKDSPPAFSNLLVYRDEIVPHVRNLCDAVHEHGAAIMIQLTHLGRRTRWDTGDWLPTVSPSHKREPAHRAFPKQIEDWDIQRIITEYADAAERMQAGGMDGIELEAYGHLMDQFWSPLTNTLDAPYGGSVEQRVQFTLDVLAAIRQRVGDEFIIGVRACTDELLDRGLSKEDGLQIAQILKATGQVDFLNIIRGHIDTDAGLTDVIPIQGMRNNPHLDFAGEIRSAIGLPTLHAAKIPDLATARYAIAEGKLDLVGMTRAHMADPHLVKKLIEGREEQIRPCVGANYCLDRIYQGGAAFCIHNPSTGREEQQPHLIQPADQKRQVVIVGAGPAGLEAARVSAERSHQVTVFEASNNAGGQIALTARSERRREMQSIIDWRLAECERLGVEIRYNSWAEASDIINENPDLVIIATGGYPQTEILESGNEHVSSCWDVLAGDCKPTQRVLIFDDAGDHVGLQAAEILAKAGSDVEIMTPDRSFAPEVMGMNLVPYMRSLQSLNTRFTVTYRLISVEKKSDGLHALIGSDYGSTQHVKVYDQILINHGTLPLDELYFELKPLSSNLGQVDYDQLINSRPQTVQVNKGGAFQLYRIGDAVSSRNTHAAIYDALRLMREL